MVLNIEEVALAVGIVLNKVEPYWDIVVQVHIRIHLVQNELVQGLFVVDARDFYTDLWELFIELLLIHFQPESPSEEGSQLATGLWDLLAKLVVYEILHLLKLAPF